MKITKRQLRRIIKEEKARILSEQGGSEEKYILDKLDGVISLFDEYGERFGSYDFAEEDPESEEKAILDKMAGLRGHIEAYFRMYPSDGA